MCSCEGVEIIPTINGCGLLADNGLQALYLGLASLQLGPQVGQVGGENLLLSEVSL